MKYDGLWKTALVAGAMLMLAACGGPTIRVGLSSNANLNLNANSEPLPVVVRIYQLSDRAAFDNATFADIWKRDNAVLGNALLTRNEVVMNPSAQNEVEFDRHAQARYVGVAAIFRSPIESKWRAVYELSDSWLGKKLSTSFSVSLVGNTLHITD